MKRAIVLIIFVVASAALVGCPSLSVKSFKFTTYSNYSGNSELNCKSDAEKTKSACAVSFSMLRSYEYMKTASSLAEENIWYDYILIDSAAAGAGALLFESNLNLVKGLGLGAAYIVGLKTYANVDARARYLVTASEASDCVAKAASVCAYQDIDDFSQDVTELNGLINNELMTYNTGFIYPEYKKLYEDALKTALSTESLANQAKYVRNNCKNTVLTNINAIDRKNISLHVKFYS